MEATAWSPKDKLAARARELGVCFCGIAKAAGARPHAAEVRAWLDDGAAGDMQWMERGAEKRSDLQQILPGARSIVVVALNYWQGDEDSPRNQGRIARYAWGDDYH